MIKSTDRLKLSKREVARRQLDAAIDLWFKNYDPVPVHTLAAAAHEMFADICKHQGLPALMFDIGLYQGGKAGLARKALHQYYNFFKHANNDPRGVTDFPTEVSEGFIMMAIEGWRNLGGEQQEMDEAFMVYFFMRHPEIHRTDSVAQSQHILGIRKLAQIMRHEDRRKFRDEFIAIYHLLIAQRKPKVPGAPHSK